tara:strand:- start:448 stop:1167 length:720 start_codon:yes stop_codon:yes gene_type:complete
MAYIGRQLVLGQNRVLDDISSGFNGSTTTFNLTVSSSAASPGSSYQLWIVLNNVLQEPGTAFTVAASQITFTSAPGAGVSFWGLIQGDVTDSNTPSDGSVSPAKVANSGNFTFPGTVTSSLELVSASDSATALSAAQSVNSFVVMTPSAARNVTTATAANIVTQLGTNVKVGTTFTITLRNQASATHAMTLVGGSGVTLDSDNTNTVAATKTRQFLGRVTNKTSSSEAVTIYSLGESVH